MATSEWTADIPAVGNQISSDVPNIEKNFEEVKEILDDVTDGTVGTTDTASFNLKKLGYVTKYIGAVKMVAKATNGAEAGITNMSGNSLRFDHYAFDGATEEYVYAVTPMPEGWDLGTVKVKCYWLPSSGCSAGDTVEWEIAGLAVSNDDALDGSFGTAQVISDTVTAGENADLHVTAATPAITIGGTPALGDLIALQISRNVSGTDDMAEDARLIGVLIQFTVDQSISAW